MSVEPEKSILMIPPPAKKMEMTIMVCQIFLNHLKKEISVVIKIIGQIKKKRIFNKKGNISGASLISTKAKAEYIKIPKINDIRINTIDELKCSSEYFFSMSSA